VHGALDKLNFRDSAPSIIRQKAEDWLKRRLSVEGLDNVYPTLEQKVRGTYQVALTQAEVKWLMNMAFGERSSATRPRVQYIGRISVSLMEGGRSRSVVALAKPVRQDGAEGIWCVLKMGPREETDESIVDTVSMCGSLCH